MKTYFKDKTISSQNKNMLEKRLFYIVLQKFLTIKKRKWYRIDLQIMLLNETLKTNLKQDYQNWK